MMNENSDRTMMLESLLQERRSIRGFRPDRVSDEILTTIFTMAGRAPSNCNVQPWVVHIVSDAAAERMRSRLYEHAHSNAPLSPDFALTGAYPGIYRTRQVEAAKALFYATGVARDDLPARTESFLRNFRFFDAPHAAFIFMPEWAGIREAADCGIYVQTLMLALSAYGLGSCPQGALGHYGDIVRDQLELGSEYRLLLGIAFGYPDQTHPANNARTERAALADTSYFHSE